MSDYLQLSVKRRQMNGGFLDILRKEYQDYKNDPQNIDNRLRERVGTWLIEDDFLPHASHAGDSVLSFNIPDTVMKRICEIAGHVWLEFVEGADNNSIRATGDYPRDSINAYVAEFIPEPDIDSILEVFGGEEVLWANVTPEHLLRLFAPFLEESQDDRKPAPRSLRSPAGALNGYVSLLSPDKLREYSVPWFRSWFKDRMGADKTPTWHVSRPSVVVESFQQKDIGLRYSFTPEHYQNADNCLTWASRVLDDLVPGNWLDTVRIQCRVEQLQCGKDPATLAPATCNDYHLREQGRMKCIALYASDADKAREAGLKRFE
jgi:hypothetical protein